MLIARLGVHIFAHGSDPINFQGKFTPGAGHCLPGLSWRCMPSLRPSWL